MDVCIVWLLTSILVFISVVDSGRMRCGSEEDCPGGAFCFKDECPRCICPSGKHVVKLFTDGQLFPLCEHKPPTTQSPLVGDPCDVISARDPCPYNSFCADSGACVCESGLLPNSDRSYCRLALFDEECDDQHPCDGRSGFECDSTLGVCGCAPAFRRPNEWTRFILQRWDYSLVEEGEQKCVARAVGEPCTADNECNAVRGSGAVCSPCGFCQCRHPDHVPDVLGTKCGPGQSLADVCTLDSASVCDGTRGLQCGDVCDLYFGYHGYPVAKKCTCSQMHDKRGDSCSPKVVGSECSTDLDCYPLSDGYGYCNSGRCAVNGKNISINYHPDLVNKVCDLSSIPAATEPMDSLLYADGHPVPQNTSGRDPPPMVIEIPDTEKLDSDTLKEPGTKSRKDPGVDVKARSSSISSSSSSSFRQAAFLSQTHSCLVMTVLLHVVAMATRISMTTP